MPTKPVDQLAIDETVVENAELEAALEARWAAKQVVSTARGEFDTAHAAVVTAIEELKLEDGAPIRVGRFRVEKRSTPPRHVKFDTEGGTRIVIDAGDDE